tara:strand:- start:128 stop:439 length:312 start_codon:yes stop_codon:yes gene_type:complete
MSKIEESVIQKIQSRAAVGKSKYGVTMERQDLSRLEWLIHAQEEAMDLAVYLEKCIHEEADFLTRVEEQQRVRETKPFRYEWNTEGDKGRGFLYEYEGKEKED